MIYIDFETYSELDIRKVGTYKYAESCSVLLMAYAIGNDPVQVWDATDESRYPDLLDHIRDFPTTEFIAHNAQFDRNVLKYALGVDTRLDQWQCSMVKAMAHSLPGGLEQLGHAIGLDADMKKIKDGKKLIQRFCKPAPKNHKAKRYDRHTHPEEWARFIEYARMDVEAMRHIWKLLPNWNYSGSELDLWRLDQKINARGFKVDIELAEAAIRATTRCQELLASEIDELTCGKVQRATQRDRLLEHIANEYGVKMDGLTKADVEAALNNPDILDPVKRLLVIRQKASKTSAAKYQKLIDVVSEDGRLKGGLQFDGASRTRRWSGRMFQPQNLPRPTMNNEQIDIGIEAMKNGCEDLLFDNVMALASSAIRGAIVSGKGKKLVISDLSNIEGRMNAWLSGEDWKIKAFSDFDEGIGHDIYNLSYAKSFHKPVKEVTKDERQIGKVQELLLQYQGALGACHQAAAAYGIEFPDTKWLQIVKAWRSAHPNIVNMWYALERAAVKATKNPDVTFTVKRLAFRRLSQWLLMKLPSGQVICYYQPELDGEGKVTYMGMNQYTRKWERLHTYGGKFLENACQSVSRDVMAHGMQPAEDTGYAIVLTVHDELITETPDTDEYSVKGLSDILATNPPWAEGLPLAADGFETYRYRKE